MTDLDISKERDILAKAYNIIDELNAQAPAANFPEVVEGAQKNRVFHDMLQHVEEMGISPATFIAVHALAQCADALDEISEGDVKSMNEKLYESVRRELGQDIYDNLREWMGGLRMDDSQLEHSTQWAKLGAMSRSLEVADAFAPGGVQFSQESSVVLSGVIASQERVAHAFKDLGPLYNYYTGRLEEMVRAAEKAPTFRASGPGLSPS
jgi:hypothetical protein